MRSGMLGILMLIVTSATLVVQAGAPTHVHGSATVGDDVDLHALCEELARDCWDLDLTEFGMTPVSSELPPLPEGTLVERAGGGGVDVQASLLGERVHVHGDLHYSLSTGYHADPHDGDHPVVPCGDANGHCPDLRVRAEDMALSAHLSTETFTDDHCAVLEESTQPGERRLLRFAFESPNDGLGALVIGDPDDHPEWFQWGDCHGHWHFREYADYRLWDPAGYAAWKTIRSAYPHLEPGQVLDAFPELRDHFRAGHKQGFCVKDMVPPPVFLGRGPFNSCEDMQGISPGWADRYHAGLDGQWVDVTDLEPGAYVLEAEVNPERFFAESSYSNNDSAWVVAIV